MTKKTPYSFVILRYFHDVVVGEFVNMGVLLYAPDVQLLSFIVSQKAVERARGFFGESFQEGAVLATLLSLGKPENPEDAWKLRSSPISLTVTVEEIGKTSTAYDIAQRLLPLDDSSFQWSSMMAGITNHPEAEILAIFERYVERFV